MRPRVSVVLPVHDAEETLGKALESLLEQRMPDFELIVILDTCRDASQAIAENYAGRDERVRLIATSGGPDVGRAAEVGLAACTTAFVARMDADDVAYPERLRWQLEQLQADPALAAVSGQVDLLDAQGKEWRDMSTG